MGGPEEIEPLDDDEDWEGHAYELGFDVDDYEAYVERVEQENEDRQKEYGGTLDEMFPDGVDEDSIFNREED